MKVKNIFIVMLAVGITACNSTSKPVIIPDAIFDSQGKRVITSFFNKKKETISTLYGNELAFNAIAYGASDHVAGEIFTLVTWYQQADPYWYGCNINSETKSIEEITIVNADKNLVINYKVLHGDQGTSKLYLLKKQERIDFILAQKASVFP